MARAGIIGAGTWGCALAMLLHDNGHTVTVWSALSDEARQLQADHEHKNLPGVHLPEEIVFTDSLAKAMTDRDLLVRVAGYSTYFTEMSPVLQDDLINRTELSLD